jgi:hypothetical protein
MVSGLVQSIDLKAGTLVIQPGGAGIAAPGKSAPAGETHKSITITVTRATAISSQAPGNLKDCSVGNWARVTKQTSREGNESVLMLTLLTGEPPAPRTPPPGAGARNHEPKGDYTIEQVTGKIIELNPLTIKLQEGGEQKLKVSAQTRVTKNLTLALGDIKQGQQALVIGQRANELTLTATQIIVSPRFAPASHPLPTPGGAKPAPAHT